MNSEIEQMRAVIDALPDPVFILTESGRYAGIVGGRDSRYYHDGSALVGKTLFDVLPQEKADWFLNQISLAINENCLQTVEYGLGGEDVDGLDTDSGPAGTLWFEGRIQPLTSTYEGERAVVWVARNITHRYDLEIQLRRLSELDELTGIYNRRKFLSELKLRFNELKRYKTTTSILMIDIDHFKNINDRFGHLTGDDVIRDVVNTCQKQLRDTDHLARFGGEEFVCLMPHTSIDEAEKFANRLRESVMNQVILPDNETNLTISIGVSQLYETDHNEEDAIRRADNALYIAKDKGRNQVVVDQN